MKRIIIILALVLGYITAFSQCLICVTDSNGDPIVIPFNQIEEVGISKDGKVSIQYADGDGSATRCYVTESIDDIKEQIKSCNSPAPAADIDTYATTEFASTTGVDVYGVPFEPGDKLIITAEGDTICVPQKTLPIVVQDLLNESVLDSFIVTIDGIDYIIQDTDTTLSSDTVVNADGTTTLNIYNPDGSLQTSVCTSCPDYTITESVRNDSTIFTHTWTVGGVTNIYETYDTDLFNIATIGALNDSTIYLSNSLTTDSSTVVLSACCQESNVVKVPQPDGTNIYEFYENGVKISEWCDGVSVLTDHHGINYATKSVLFNEDFYFNTTNEDDAGVNIGISGADYSDDPIVGTRNHSVHGVINSFVGDATGLRTTTIASVVTKTGGLNAVSMAAEGSINDGTDAVLGGARDSENYGDWSALMAGRDVINNGDYSHVGGQDGVNNGTHNMVHAVNFLVNGNRNGVFGSNLNAVGATGIGPAGINSSFGLHYGSVINTREGNNSLVGGNRLDTDISEGLFVGRESNSNTTISDFSTGLYSLAAFSNYNEVREFLGFGLNLDIDNVEQGMALGRNIKIVGGSGLGGDMSNIYSIGAAHNINALATGAVDDSEIYSFGAIINSFGNRHWTIGNNITNGTAAAPISRVWSFGLGLVNDMDDIWVYGRYNQLPSTIPLSPTSSDFPLHMFGNGDAVGTTATDIIFFEDGNIRTSGLHNIAGAAYPTAASVQADAALTVGDIVVLNDGTLVVKR